MITIDIFDSMAIFSLNVFVLHKADSGLHATDIADTECR
jgi:hypothetical protein